MPFVFAPCAQSVIPVQDERYEFFPVHRVYCVARNYPSHAAEMGTQEREAPFFFMKPADAIVPIADGESFKMPYAQATEMLHHEVELVAVLDKGGKNLSLEEAEKAIFGWCVGIDFTRRDLQKAQSAKGRPWDIAKGFDQSAPVSHIRPHHRCPLPSPVDLWLYVNNDKRQAGRSDQMIFSPAEIIAELSKYYELQPGDVIFTGTPGGVSSVVEGDKLKAGIGGVGTIEVEIVKASE